MDLMGLIAILRWPLEIVAFAPDRWGSRARVWILPALALVVYGFMNQVSGTWAWAFLGNMELPAGAEFPLLFKAVIGLLMAYSNAMLIRVFRSQEEAPSGWYLCGFTMLVLASPLALSVVAL